MSKYIRPVLFWTYIVLAALLIGFFAVGYSARYLHPSYAWWAEIIAVGLPYMSVLVLGFAGIAYAIRHRMLMVVFSILLLLVAIRFLPPTIIPVSSPSESDLTIIALNVTHWAENPEDKGRRLVDLARTEEPAIMALQEAQVLYAPDGNSIWEMSEYLEGLRDTLGYEVPLIQLVAESRTRRYRRIDQSIFAKVPILEQEQMFLAEELDDTGRANAVRTVFEWEGRQAVLYNVHLRSFGRDKPWHEGLSGPLSLNFWYRYLRQFRDAFRIRAHEAEELRERIEAEELPVIIAGDFNSTPHSWVFRKLLDGKQDAFRYAGWGWGGTYHSRVPLVRIDHVVASKDWEVTGARVINSGDELSQHRPVKVHLRWRD